MQQKLSNYLNTSILNFSVYIVKWMHRLICITVPVLWSYLSATFNIVLWFNTFNVVEKTCFLIGKIYGFSINYQQTLFIRKKRVSYMQIGNFCDICKVSKWLPLTIYILRIPLLLLLHNCHAMLIWVHFHNGWKLQFCFYKQIISQKLFSLFSIYC